MIDLNSVETGMPMQVEPWLELSLPPNIIKYLWETVEKGEERGKCMKSTLAGNISTSFALNDENNYFYHEVLEPLINVYMTNVVDARSDCRRPSLAVDVDGNPLKVTKQSIVLTSFWANYQYKHEFNPAHDHGGAFSFVIWLKIPYSWKEQKKLPQFKGTSDNQKLAGSFYFDHLTMFGKPTTTLYPLDETMEGKMLFFPANLRHGVQPFYECDEKRVSISGNLDFLFQYEKA